MTPYNRYNKIMLVRGLGGISTIQITGLRVTFGVKGV